MAHTLVCELCFSQDHSCSFKDHILFMECVFSLSKPMYFPSHQIPSVVRQKQQQKKNKNKNWASLSPETRCVILIKRWWIWIPACGFRPLSGFWLGLSPIWVKRFRYHPRVIRAGGGNYSPLPDSEDRPRNLKTKKGFPDFIDFL